MGTGYDAQLAVLRRRGGTGTAAARSIMIPVLAALGAAISFALAAVLQQEAAQTAAPDASLSFRLLVLLVRRRRWLAGVGLLVTGYGLQALALANGPLALVQPVVATELAFAVPVGIWRGHRRAGRREWAGIAAVVVGVSIFLLLASPQPGTAHPDLVDWVASLVPVVGVVGATLVAARAIRGARRATLLGAAAGLSFGLLAVLTKALTSRFGEGPVGVLASWELYAVVGLGICALIVSQSAYQAGPLALALPPIALLEPVVAVLIGDTVFAEQARLNGAALAGELGAAGMAATGIVVLATSPIVLKVYEQAPGGDRQR